MNLTLDSVAKRIYFVSDALRRRYLRSIGHDETLSKLDAYCRRAVINEIMLSIVLVPSKYIREKLLARSTKYSLAPTKEPLYSIVHYTYVALLNTIKDHAE